MKDYHKAYLEAITKDWNERNPNACVGCSGRPGMEDGEDGSDHYSWCKLVSAQQTSNL